MILLNTHVVYWSVTDPARLGPQTKDLINRSIHRYVSSVSHVEFRIKAMKGRLRLPDNLPAALASNGLLGLPFSGEHAAAMEWFPELSTHEPFDRMLLAQAAHERLTFLTADRRLLDLNRPWISNATA